MHSGQIKEETLNLGCSAQIQLYTHSSETLRKSGEAFKNKGWEDCCKVVSSTHDSVLYREFSTTWLNAEEHSRKHAKMDR